MTSLLHVDSSASPIENSVSRQLTALYAERWPGRYVHRDLARDPVPLIGPAYVTLGTRVEREGAGVLPADAGEEREWALTEPLIAELRAADVVLLGVPMYNFGVPTSLKAWIDRISFPSAYDDAAGQSVLRDTTVIAVLTRGGAYGPGTPRAGCDFQEPYLRAHFGKLGVTDLRFVCAEMTRADDIPGLAEFREMKLKSLAAAREQLIAMR
ncbi:NAD(P)H dehydrogenase [Amycolatopsis sp. K13G38]|uniref:FMN dependent NADH:quinone oxidoreductase n=1 Tax=Amycolatopsis acididurans TaxID=2724524 RepID=A0ABX1J0P1_9PSEU|nr:NAD(P)H-dependent oxidoreductase [Amycolatopsis acididurans]NKQ52961.1 NAD(P)H dehydrogenase [Amycolatopsis acididurans]